MRRLQPPARALAGALATALGAGCHHAAPPARVAQAPAVLEEEHCWWAVFRTALPPDTVAARFARAFTAIGLTGAEWARVADTARAQAGPTVLGGAWGGGTYAARVVAFRRGDTTLFRHFVAIAPPPHGWATTSPPPGGGHVGVCAALGQAAAVHGTAPRDPSGEEGLRIWTRP